MFFSHEKISINLIKYFIDFLFENSFSIFFSFVNCILQFFLTKLNKKPKLNEIET